MRKIGLIGGMSWESTGVYYSLINKGINSILGKNHSAELLIYSVDFQEIEELQYSENWVRLEQIIISAGNKLKLAGAELIVICSNTMHKVVNSFEERVGVPLIHIADVVGETIRNQKIKTIGLLGTKFTMEQDFYLKRLEEKYGILVLVPNKDDRDAINSIIFEELVKGQIRAASRALYYNIMDQLIIEGAEGIVLGCTEIGLLVKDYKKPIFDSMIIHTKKIVEVMVTELL